MIDLDLNLGFKSKDTLDLCGADDCMDVFKQDTTNNITASEADVVSKTWVSDFTDIKLNELRRSGFDVNASYTKDGIADRVEVRVNTNVAANTVFNIVASTNENIVISYKDTLDSESARLARKTKKPLWLVSFADGVVVLERQF